MRKIRIRVDEVDSVYHCMSRTVNGERLLGPEHRKVFRKMLVEAAEFSGVRVITYCLMENHFHVLVRVCAGDDPSDEELVRRYRVLYPTTSAYQPMSGDRLEEILEQGGAEAERVRSVLLARMGDVSEFMKTLKQRYSIWFNNQHGRYGPLWSDRFKSVLVEGDAYSLKTVAAYIDLNPVRAGMVADPKDYPFCGYGRACAGGRFEREGIGSLTMDRGLSLLDYRAVLFGKGRIAGAAGEVGESESEGMEEVEDRAVAEPRSASLLQTIRHFANGKILGSEGFVQRVMEEIEIFREVATRRRCPVDVSGVYGFYSGTPVRRPKACLRKR